MKWRWLPFAGIGLFYAVVNVSVAPATYNVDSVGLLMAYCLFSFGVIMSQPAVLSIWGVLGAGQFWKRMAATLAAVVLLFACWGVGLVGAAINDARQYRDVMAEVVSELSFLLDDVLMVVMLCFPLFLLVVQAPLWPVRIWLGWRIEHQHEDSDAPRPLSIRDMMIATVVVAGVLGLTRLALGFAYYASEFWMGVLTMIVISAGISLVMTLPPLAIVLRSRETLFAYVGLAVYTICALVITLIAFCLTWWVNGGPVTAGSMVRIAALLSGMAAGLWPPLLVARHQGYRLRWGKVDLLPSEASE